MILIIIIVDSAWDGDGEGTTSFNGKYNIEQHNDDDDDDDDDDSDIGEGGISEKRQKMAAKKGASLFTSAMNSFA